MTELRPWCPHGLDPSKVLVCQLTPLPSKEEEMTVRGATAMSHQVFGVGYGNPDVFALARPLTLKSPSNHLYFNQSDPAALFLCSVLLVVHSAQKSIPPHERVQWVVRNQLAPQLSPNKSALQATVTACGSDASSAGSGATVSASGGLTFSAAAAREAVARSSAATSA